MVEKMQLNTFKAIVFLFVFLTQGLVVESRLQIHHPPALVSTYTRVSHHLSVATLSRLGHREEGT